MSKRLTDKQKKKMIADYIQCQNYSEVGRTHGVSPNTVKAIVQKDPSTAGKCEQKKSENTQDVLEYMEGKKVEACRVIDLLLLEMQDEEKIKRTGLQAIATSLGIVIDKFTANATPNTISQDMAEDNRLLKRLFESGDKDSKSETN